MEEVKCQECGGQIGFYTASELQKKIDSGEIVKGRAYKRNADEAESAKRQVGYSDGFFGICRVCRRDYANAPLLGNDPEGARHRRIMERLAAIRRNDPGMSLEEAAMRATEDEFEPENEPNPEFRRYLMERGTKSAAADAAAREVIKSLE